MVADAGEEHEAGGNAENEADQAARAEHADAVAPAAVVAFVAVGVLARDERSGWCGEEGVWEGEGWWGCGEDEEEEEEAEDGVEGRSKWHSWFGGLMIFGG